VTEPQAGAAAGAAGGAPAARRGREKTRAGARAAQGTAKRRTAVLLFIAHLIGPGAGLEASGTVQGRPALARARPGAFWLWNAATVTTEAARLLELPSMVPVLG